MITLSQPPIVHNSPDRWDALALIGAGIAIACLMAALVWLSGKANDYWTDRADAKAEHDALVARRTESWCRTWLDGRAAGAAAIEASVARREQHVILTTVRASNPRRLADFAAEQKRRAS